ncbi:MAG: PIN domain-containing protein [Propionibacteriaceae bacterium]|jgi:predicted nucleic acid-binding protein|nr:PIN domain-containing protein [Propionibacteriaceae bacterium]
MIVDTNVLLAFFHPKEQYHEVVSEFLSHVSEPLVVSPYVIAELDYLVLTRCGVRDEIAALRALLGPAWEIAKVTDAQLVAATDLVEKYADLRLGLTDAVNITVADAYRTRRIATLDHRHYRAVTFPDGTAVEIVP